MYLSRRYFLFLIALFVNAFGIAFITKAALGTSPITSVTYVLSMFTPYTIGVWTILLNLFFVILDLFLMTRQQLKDDLRNFLLQIPISFCFGFFIDVSMYLLWWIEPTLYLSKIIYLLIGCIILAMGITLEVKANVAMMAGEYLVKAITQRFRLNFGYVKLGLDITLLVLAGLLSLIFLSDIEGVREGTVIAALMVGPIVHFMTPYYRFLDNWIGDAATPQTTAVADNRHIIITIAREFGSGGHIFGEMLSKRLGIKLYDKEFIHMAVQRSGMDEAYIMKNEQSLPSFWLKCIVSKNSEQPLESSLSADDVLFVSECKIVQELAEKESCIIVGRCADFVLKNNPNVLKIFCYSDYESAVKRCIGEYGLSKEKAESEIKRVNRNRIRHYEYYTGRKWGDAHNYDLLFNTGDIELEMASQLVETICRDMEAKIKTKHPA